MPKRSAKLLTCLILQTILLAYLPIASAEGEVTDIQPGYVRVDLPPVTSEEADLYAESRQIPPDLISDVTGTDLLVDGTTALDAPIIAAKVGGSASPTAPPSIAALTRSLRNNPDLIYQYVRNNIEYYPGWGLQKGALGAIIENQGTAFDQANLMVALLRQAGFTATYVKGRIELTAAQVKSWLGVPTTDACAVRRLFAVGGVPTGAMKSSLQGGACPADSAGQAGELISLQIDHVWVKVNIGGTFYAFDPSFKPHTLKSGINLPATTKFVPATYLSQAKTSPTFALTANYIQGVNRTNIRNNLTAYANNLAAYLRTNLPSATLDDVLGGKAIVPYHDSALRETELAYQTTSALTEWDTDIPANLKTTLNIQYSGINQTYTSDALYGKRLAITYDATNHPLLRLDGVVQATGLAVIIDPNPNNNPKIKFTVDHPYNGPNQNFTQSLEPGGTYLVSNSWGPVGNGLVEYHRKRLEQAKAAGASDASEAVLGSNLAILSATWVAQTNASLYMTNRMSNTSSQYHHQVGIAGYKTSSFVDLPGNVIGTVSLAGNAAMEDAVFFSASAHSSVFESLAVQQTSGVSAVSTVKLIDIAAAANDKIFNATGANYVGVVKPNLVGCDSWLNSFQSAVTTTANHPGHRLILPAHCDIKEGSWTGAGFFDILSTATKTSIGSIIAGGLNGGFGSNPLSTSTFTSNALNTVSQFAVSTFSNLATTFGDPIDMAKGDYLYSHEDINTGVGPFPQALLFSKLYSSSNRYQDGPLGKGWTHNFAASAGLASNSFQGLGEDSALDAVNTLAEQMVALNLLADPAKPLDKMVIATLGQRWFADTQINNTVVVKQGLGGEIFVRLQDGTYNPPQGSSAKLIKNADNTFTYDSLHRNQLKFDAAGNVAVYTDASGVQAKFAYVGGNLASVTNSLGRSLALTYVGDRIDAVKDGTRLVQYDYDAAGNLLTYTDAALQKTQFKYASPGLMTQVFYPANPTLAFVTNIYDGLGRVATQTNASDQVYTYFFAGSRSEEVDPLGNSKVTYLDAFGKVLRAKDPRGFTTINSYDGQERLVATVFPEGNAVQYEYDDATCASAQKRCTHNVKTETKIAKPGTGLGNLVNKYLYEGTYNQLSYHTNPKNKVTHYTYTKGQLATVTRPADAAGVAGLTTYGYTTVTPAGFNAFVLPSSVTAHISATETVVNKTTYDPANKYVPKTKVVDAGTGLLNLTTTYTYDSFGNLRVVNGPRTDVTDTVTTDYDAERRPIQVTNALGKISKLRYNADGRLALTAAQLGTEWSVSCRNYFPSGKLKTTWGPVLGAVDNACPILTDTVPTQSYAYDALDRLSRAVEYLPVIEGGNRITDTLYYADNAIKTVRSAVGTGLAQDTASYTYTDNGLPETVKDAEGNLTTTVYDGHDRKSKVFYPDKTVANQSSGTDFEQYHYDANGNVFILRKRDGQLVNYGYDDLDRVLTATYPNAADNIAYGYDLLDRRKLANKPGYGISYIWDHASRLKSTTAGGKAMAYLYDQAGNRTRTTWPETAFFVTTSYDALNRPVSIKELGTTNLVTSYAYDDLSRRKAVNWGNATATGYAYNDSSSLSGLAHNLGGTANDINWVLARNRAQELDGLTWNNNAYQWQGYTNGSASYNANGLNQYAFAGPAAIGHDDNGNLSSDGTWAYSYDTDNRLANADKAGIAATLGYDALGRLHKIDINGTVTEQLYDGDDLVAEYGTDGTLLRRYVHGPGTDEPIARYEGAGTAAKLWLYADHQGSIVAAANTVGNMATTHSYGPFGEPDRIGGLKHRFTGQQWLAGINLYYYKARMYSPALGRFLQPDPIGYGDGLNLYAYVGNNPINFADPSGLIASEAGLYAGNLSNQFKETAVAINEASSMNSYLKLNLLPAQNFIDDVANGDTGSIAIGIVASANPLGQFGNRIHHIASNKNSIYTSQFKDIADKYGLKLNSAWNKANVSSEFHNSKHPNSYHKFVLQGMKAADNLAGGNQAKFLKLYDEFVKQPLLKNLSMLKN